MKRLLSILILSLFILPATAIAQEDAPPENGSYKRYYPSGALLAKEKYKNGLLNGVAKSYYENGALSVEAKFKDGKTDGTETAYYANGKIKRTAEYKDGIMQGVLKLFDEEGRLTNEVTVIDGKKEGLARAFRKDNTLNEECTFADDERISCSYFNEKGALRAKSQKDPNDPNRTIYLTYDDAGKLIEAQQTVDE